MGYWKAGHNGKQCGRSCGLCLLRSNHGYICDASCFDVIAHSGCNRHYFVTRMLAVLLDFNTGVKYDVYLKDSSMNLYVQGMADTSMAIYIAV